MGYGAQPGYVGGPQPMGRPCPFCGTPVAGPLCQTCGQDPTAPRRPCRKCGRPTPSAVKQCLHCHAAQGSEMPGKIIIIVLMFAAAFILSIVLHSL